MKYERAANVFLFCCCSLVVCRSFCSRHSLSLYWQLAGWSADVFKENRWCCSTS